uniref:Helicase C-terminal domain-containing protein n=1 Tax=Parastrongyloides trichosuri TaxID=131310 RepID=A0A0N4Z810_PARTI
MIFCGENEKINRLTQLLSILFKDSSIGTRANCSLFPRKCLTLIKLFRNKDIHVLVCSSAMSRGVDIENLDCVINNG